MFKILLPIALLVSTSMAGQITRDTIWQDANKFPTTEANAVYYTVRTPIKNKQLVDFETFQIDTKKLIQKGQGTISDAYITSYEGELQDFDKSGKKISSTFYAGGEIQKIYSTNPVTNEQYELLFKEGTPYQGKTILILENAYINVVVEDGFYKTYEIFNPANPKNKLVYYFDDANAFAGEEYFDASGTSISKATYSADGSYDGSVADIDFNDFKLENITKYKDGIYVSKKSFFKNGELKSEESTSDKINTTTFYDQSGKVIGIYTVTTLANEYDTVVDGTLYVYEQKGPLSDNLYYIYTYKQNNLQQTITYKTEKGKNYVDNIAIYSDTYPKSTTYFNPDGSQKASLTYKLESYEPNNGTQYDDQTVTIYNNGTIVESKTYYINGKLFSDENAKNVTFYDKQGKVIGKATYAASEYDYKYPQEGTIFTLYDDEIYSKTTYKNGQTVYEGSYQINNGKSILKEESFYNNSVLSKKITYHNNGKKQIEATYASTFTIDSPTYITYFDKTGKIIGQYDAVKMDGTKYEFFTDEQPQIITKYKNGELLYAKQYARKWSNDEAAYSLDSYYLVSEIDFNKQGTFYKQNGEVLSVTSYKNGAPFTGRTCDANDSYVTYTEYKNGNKVGIEEVYVTYDEELYEKNHYNAGVLTKKESYINGTISQITPYENDDIEGDVVYFDVEGAEIARLTYEAGLPVEGESITADNNYITKETYANGVRTGLHIYNYDDYTLLMEEIRIDENTQEKKIYNSNGELMYQFTMQNEVLHGNYTYYVDGKAKYKAILKEGILESGSIVITDIQNLIDTYGYYTEESTTYTVITVTKKDVTLQKFDKDTNALVSKTVTKVNKGSISDIPYLKSAIKTQALYPTDISNSSYSYY